MPEAVKFTVLNTIFWVGLHFGGSWLCLRLFPPRNCRADSFWFRIRPFEAKLYKLLRVKRWKDHLPEAGSLGGFPKDRLYRHDKEYYRLFVQQTCFAEVVHLTIAVLGFLSVPLNGKAELFWSLPLAVFFALVQLPFIIIQRYNRPRLLRLCGTERGTGVIQK